MLFDKVGLSEPPTPEPESLEQRIERASTQVGFFWIIACGCARALVANKLPLFYSSLLDLERALGEVKAALRGEHAPYLKSINQPLHSTAEQCVVILRGLCDEMQGVMAQVAQLGGYVPTAPRSLVEMRLALLSLED
ncbi:hypothetical protein [Dictyobacter aurantiacus]|uniref:Uncharacterized protein n=1 Tax=Dictyobacter aurantiacus TaxID=1936993 RepID=A0A401ZNL8_9CHLR|nr:hypothetical protein [Dictyobacter aurantiacus]GCE08400.1 hypothetical protein KDAU_57290 [Dictyobacter aurantiacus]